jgi:hypothetical protein
MFNGAAVLDGADVRLGVYLPKGWTPEDLWVVYKNSTNALELKSSDIVAICKRTGQVVYEGSACDEG